MNLVEKKYMGVFCLVDMDSGCFWRNNAYGLKKQILDYDKMPHGVFKKESLKKYSLTNEDLEPLGKIIKKISSEEATEGKIGKISTLQEIKIEQKKDTKEETKKTVVVTKKIVGRKRGK